MADKCKPCSKKCMCKDKKCSCQKSCECSCRKKKDKEVAKKKASITEITANKWLINKNEVTLKLASSFILDSFIGNKTAQSKMDEESCEILSIYVAVLRALYLIHQQNHWETKEYNNHLLFQRLYENVQESVDAAGERVVGLCGELKHKGVESQIANKFKRDSSNDDLATACIESSLTAEKEYQKVVKNVYDKLKEKDLLSLGLDDLLMSQASEGETRIYLLEHAQ